MRDQPAGRAAGGPGTGVTWLRIALTYLVPFPVANYGILAASRSTRPDGIVSSGRPSWPG